MRFALRFSSSRASGQPLALNGRFNDGQKSEIFERQMEGRSQGRKKFS